MTIPPVSAGAAANEPQALTRACRDFEAIIWRQVAEKSLQPLLSGAAQPADPTGTYSYFVSNTLAEAAASRSGGFAALLEAQLSPPKSPHPR